MSESSTQTGTSAGNAQRAIANQRPSERRTAATASTNTTPETTPSQTRAAVSSACGATR